MKKVIALLGAMTLTASLLLSGCGGSDNGTAGNAKDTDSAAANDGSDGQVKETEGDNTVNMDDLPVIKMATMTGANYDDTDAVEAEINKILAEKVGAVLDIT